jgi:hypothetical protein
MTNIRCKGGKEIDLLAMNPMTMQRYHIESRISTTFKLKLEATYTKDGRCHKNGLDYFKKDKFEHPLVKEKINEIFGETEYSKVLVVWNVEDISLLDVARKQYGFEIWFIDDLINEILVKGNLKGSRDDVLRLIELISILLKERVKTYHMRRRVTRKTIEEEGRLPQIPREEQI